MLVGRPRLSRDRPPGGGRTAGLPGHLFHLPGCWGPGTGQTGGRTDSGLAVELVLGRSEQVPVCQPQLGSETSWPSCHHVSGQPLSRNEAGLAEPPVRMKDEGPALALGQRNCGLRAPCRLTHRSTH